MAPVFPCRTPSTILEQKTTVKQISKTKTKKKKQRAASLGFVAGWVPFRAHGFPRHSLWGREEWGKSRTRNVNPVVRCASGSAARFPGPRHYRGPGSGRCSKL